MTQKEFFQNLKQGARWDIGVSINRSNALPIDANSVFKSKDELDKYAAGTPSKDILNNAYPGQVVAVVTEESTVIYYIDQNMAVQEVGIKLESDNSTIDIVDNKLVIRGFASASNNTLLFKNKDGLLSWSDINSLIPINGVASNDKILSIVGNKLTTSLTLEFNRAENKIKLVGKDNTVLSEIDASDFIVDSLLEDVAYSPEDNTLTFTWNTSSGKQQDIVTLTDILDPYEAGDGLTIDGVTIKVKISDDEQTQRYITASKNGISIIGLDNRFQTIDNRLEEVEKVDVAATVATALEAYSTTSAIEDTYAKKTDVTNYFNIEDEYRIIDGGRLS